MELVIRSYESHDLESVIHVFRKNVPMYFSSEEEKDLIFYLENEIEEYFVVLFQDQILGAGGINYSKDKSQGHFSWAMVDPDFHGRGIGTLLLNHRLQILFHQADVKDIYVRTSQMVYGFYEKQGFQLSKIVKNYWAPGFDLYDMKYDFL